MKTKSFFSIQSLLYNTDDLKGPLTQVLFARKFADYIGMDRVNQLARVQFENADFHKAFPGIETLKETLLIGESRINLITQHLCIRGDKSGCHVATGCFPSRTIVIHDEYRNAILPVKLSDRQIKEIFVYVWSNPELLLPIAAPFTEFE
jgi:hypothetical protein